MASKTSLDGFVRFQKRKIRVKCWYQILNQARLFLVSGRTGVIGAICKLKREGVLVYTENRKAENLMLEGSNSQLRFS